MSGFSRILACLPKSKIRNSYFKLKEASRFGGASDGITNTSKANSSTLTNPLRSGKYEKINVNDQKGNARDDDGNDAAGNFRGGFRRH
ncbi:hypothetical protein LAC03_14840 [Levilactobacillus acidifarinae]|nr:hypothetical protein LAC03_14840 [Levilactobacillus acidifarinae]